MLIFRYVFMVLSVCSLWLVTPAYPHVKTGIINVDAPLSDLVGGNDVEALSKFFGKDHALSWSLYVPKRYDPNNPPGIIVYISPSRSEAPPAQWRHVLEQENMIYISTNKAGNLTDARKRLANAVFARAYVKSHYVTDPNKTLISGFSGGARMTSRIVEIMPDVFTGALFIGGAFDWKGSKAQMRETLKGGTYVFITGKQDHARTETRRNYRQYRNTGVANVYLIDSRSLGHELPSARDFRQALKFFSRPETK